MNNSGLIGISAQLTSSSTPGILDLSDTANIKNNNVLNSRQFATSGLVLWLDTYNSTSYPGSGTTWYDLSGSGLNATGSSAITNKELLNSQAYTTATTSLLNNDIHSIGFSIYMTGASSNWDKIFGYTPSTPTSSDRSPGIWRWPTQRFLHWRYDPANTGVNIGATNCPGDGTPSTEFSDATWYYIVGVKNGSTFTVYVNGVSVGGGTVALTKTAGTSTIQLFPGFGASAKMRHAHLYNRVITDQEVLSNYNAIRSSLI
jgi:hypothetical protein